MNQSSHTNDAIAHDKDILVLSWNIATEPKLYWQLATNPYSPTTIQIVSDKFPTKQITDVINAVILAEPEGRYDRDFRLLTTIEQEKEMMKQEKILIETKEYLRAYCEKYKAELQQLSNEYLYNTLSLIAFETLDGKQILQKFPQNQRRDVKMLITELMKELKHATASKPKIQKVFVSSIKRFFMPTTLTILSILTLFFVFMSIKQDSNAVQRKGGKQIITTAQKVVPKRLLIPKINIDTTIQSVGITAQGRMDVPNSTTDVGWFDLGPRPGERGSAVIAGHLNGKNRDTAIFTNLHKLQKGDVIYVQDNKGRSTTFIVRESHLYDPGYENSVFSQNDKVHLNLITCDGTWDTMEKSYNKRLVVFSDIAPLAAKVP